MGFTAAVPSQYEERSDHQAATVGFKTTETHAGLYMPSKILMTV